MSMCCALTCSLTPLGSSFRNSNPEERGEGKGGRGEEGGGGEMCYSECVCVQERERESHVCEGVQV